MSKELSPTTRKRLNAQGLDDVDDATLAEIVPWNRMAFGVCALLAAAGVALTSTTILWILVPIAAIAWIAPVHPLDLIYNHGIRHLRKTGPLPRRAAQTRFACGVGTLWLLATIHAFDGGSMQLGYILGWSLVAVATLVATTDICIPSMIYNALGLRGRT